MKVKSESEALSESSGPHGLQPTRLLRPWDFPGKSPGLGCQFLLHQNACNVLNADETHTQKITCKSHYDDQSWRVSIQSALF